MKGIRKQKVEGLKFAMITVLEDAGYTKDHARLITGKCDCGTIRVFRLTVLRNGKQKSCGCLMTQPRYARRSKIIEIGSRSGPLIALEETTIKKGKKNFRAVMVYCEICDTTSTILASFWSKAKSCGCLRKPHDLQLTNDRLLRLRDFVNGLLLGDGFISEGGILTISQARRRLGWLKQIEEALHGFGIETRLDKRKPRTEYIDGKLVKRKPGYILRTLTYIEFKEQRKRWYRPNKIIPTDLIITPLTLTHWFAGDGSAEPDGSLNLHTNGFRKKDVILLTEMLQKDLNIDSTIKRILRKDQQNKKRKKYEYSIRMRAGLGLHIKGLIQDLLPDCVQYKLRNVRALKAPMRKIPDDRINEIRQRCAAKEPLRSIAIEFKVSDSCISLIGKYKSYKHVPNDSI